MIAFKGRLSFRQYMPAKPTKYGIKVWLGADAWNGFVLNHKVYLGKETNAAPRNGLGYEVVMDISRPFLGKNHHVYFDNFFSLPKLLDILVAEKNLCLFDSACQPEGIAAMFFSETKKRGKRLLPRKATWFSQSGMTSEMLATATR